MFVYFDSYFCNAPLQNCIKRKILYANAIVIFNVYSEL